MQKKLNVAIVAICILLAVTVSLQVAIRKEQIERKGIADKNFRLLFKELDSLKQYYRK